VPHCSVALRIRFVGDPAEFLRAQEAASVGTAALEKKVRTALLRVGSDLAPVAEKVHEHFAAKGTQLAEVSRKVEAALAPMNKVARIADGMSETFKLIDATAPRNARQHRTPARTPRRRESRKQQRRATVARRFRAPVRGSPSGSADSEESEPPLDQGLVADLVAIAEGRT
jgi:hypothetical protein